MATQGRDKGSICSSCASASASVRLISGALKPFSDPFVEVGSTANGVPAFGEVFDVSEAALEVTDRSAGEVGSRC